MYWPLGAPRVYAAQQSTKQTVRSDDEEGNTSEHETKGDASLLGIRVAKNGHYFATITAQTLSIWQTTVSLKSSRFSRF